MPTSTFDIPVFSEGLVTSVDQQDIPASAASYSENIDGDAVEGRLQGIPGSTVKSSTGSIENMGKNAFIRRDDGKYDLVYNNGTTDIRVLSDFYGTPADSQVINSIVGTSMIAHNKAVHIGTGSDSSHPPKWVGRCGWNMFGGIGKIDNSGVTGLDDCWVGGGYTNSISRLCDIQITALSVSGDTFTYAFHSPSPVSGNINMSTAVPNSDGSYDIAFGVKVYFNSTTGHTLNDYWRFYVTAPGDSINGYDAENKTKEDFSVSPVDGTFKIVSATASASTTPITNTLRRYKY